MITATATQLALPTSSENAFAKFGAKPSAKQLTKMAANTALFAIAALMMFAAVHPETRNGIHNAFINDSREVVSTASAHLAGDNRVFTVAKVKQAGALSLEVFEQLGNGQQRLVEKLALTDARDGYFDFNGQATNLAIDDINGDGRPEILAPSFDNNMVGHLNVYNFDPASSSFQKVIR